LISQKILTTQKQQEALARRIKNHRGRLKAGWMTAVFSGQIHISGANMPPQWVTRHASGARGSHVNGLSNRNFPNFTIINSAKGIGHRAVSYFVNKAVQVRAKAMSKNALLFMQGKKNLSDYASR
jgi:hypothetical protein